MILVNLFKVKGITAMFCSLMHGRPETTTVVREFIMSSAPLSPPKVDVEGIRIGSARVADAADAARRQAAAGRGRGHRRQRSSTPMILNSESKQHEQKSRGFADL